MHYLIKSLYSSEAGLNVYRKLRKIRYKEGKYVVIAAMPKSGSTFLSHTIAEVAHYEHSYFAFTYKNIEQELYFPKMIDSYGLGTVVQQHFKANDGNIELLNGFRIKPLVLVRNLSDVVISIKDHLLKEKLDNLPSVYPSNRFREYEDEQQLDYIIDFIIPWYITYYVSWCHAEADKNIEFLWLVYEAMINDWAGTVKQALEFNNIQHSQREIHDVLDNMRTKPNSSTRVNKGVSGRGKNILSEKQIARIIKLTSYYPDVNFKRIGIDN